MSEYLNRLELQPYCLYHAVPMPADADEQTSHSPPGEIQSYVCHFVACDLNWERRLGYFKTTTPQRTFQFGIGGKRCPIPQHGFLFVSGFSTAGRLWRCAIDGCTHKEVETSWANKHDQPAQNYSERGE